MTDCSYKALFTSKEHICYLEIKHHIYHTEGWESLNKSQFVKFLPLESAIDYSTGRYFNIFLNISNLKPCSGIILMARNTTASYTDVHCT